MVRVGTCKDCGTRFKVPEATRATKARCKKCGGVVEIPPAEAGDKPAAPAKPKPEAKPASPSPVSQPTAAGKTGAAVSRRGQPATRGAPTKARGKDAGAQRVPVRRAAAPATAGAAKGKPTERRRPAGKTRAAAAPGAKTKPGTGRKPRGGRGSVTAKEKKKGSPMLLILLGAVLLIGGGAAWFFWPDSDESVDSTSAVAGAGDTQTSEDDDAAGDEANVAAAPVVIDPVDELSSPEDAEAAEAAIAQAPMPKQPVASNEPVDPVIDFEPLPPNPGISQEQHDEWAQLIYTYYRESPGVRDAKAMRVQLAEIDPVDAAPAYINALIGLDMANAIDSRDAFKLVGDWMKKEAGKMHFHFPDASRMTDKDISDRALVAINWRSSWANKQTDPALIEKFRVLVAEKQAMDGG